MVLCARRNKGKALQRRGGEVENERRKRLLGVLQCTVYRSISVKNMLRFVRPVRKEEATDTPEVWGNSLQSRDELVHLVWSRDDERLFRRSFKRKLQDIPQ